MLPAPNPTASPIRNPALPVENCPGRVLLRAEGLKKRFGGQVVLDGVDLELRQGEVVLLRGENGSGKTTLLNILTGNLEPDAGTIHYQADDTPRTYRFPRRWWQELNPFDHFTPEFVAKEGVSRTWQDIRLFNSQSLRDNIAVAESGHPGENPLWALFLPKQSADTEAKLNREADAMLERLGLQGREDSSADKISLGQSKRVAIARAVAAGARILFLDEPLAGLDRKGAGDVIELLRALVLEHEVTLVLVEHVLNQPYLKCLITKDWILDQGRIELEESGARESAVGTPPPGQPSFRPYWLLKLAGEGAEIIDEPLARGALLTRIRPVVAGHRPLLEIRGLVVRRGKRAVLGIDEDGNAPGFTLTLHEGEIAILQAPNGWGKTTLLAAVAGLAQCERGEIMLAGQRMNGRPPWTRVLLGLRTLAAEGQGFSTLRVREALRLSASEAADRIPAAWQARTCDSLSGGEKRRLALASMPKAIAAVFDEPFNALDGKNVYDAIDQGWLTSSRCALLLMPYISPTAVAP